MPVEIRVLHVLESTSPAPGSVAICLPGLLNALRSVQVDGLLTDDPQFSEQKFADFQLVHIHGWDYAGAHRAARIARRLRIPYVLSPLGDWTPGRNDRIGFLGRISSYFWLRPLVRAAAALIAVNERELHELQSSAAHQQIVLLPYGHDFQTDEVAKKGVQPPAHDSLELLLLGPLDPAQGCVAALKAFAELGPAADHWRVILGGSDRGNWRGKLEAAVLRKGGADRVEFHEADSVDAQKALLERAALLVAPSLRISPAVSIMQALDAGVPVVATRNAAPPGLAGDLRVCEANRIELGTAMRAMMGLSIAQRSECAASASGKARLMFDWSVLAPRYAELYRASQRT